MKQEQGPLKEDVCRFCGVKWGELPGYEKPRTGLICKRCKDRIKKLEMSVASFAAFDKRRGKDLSLRQRRDLYKLIKTDGDYKDILDAAILAGEKAEGEYIREANRILRRAKKNVKEAPFVAHDKINPQAVDRYIRLFSGLSAGVVMKGVK